ncbi:MAG: DEAD/DEAH box helicase [Candidatus Manganitrophus sp.]|nr:DEAD/DEAH box helicase [Candidatus Manganitrophus sp.]
MTEGFSIPETKIAFLTEEALTGRSGAATQTRRRATTRDGKAKEARAGFLSSFEDLKPLDYVVHLDHGIGRYIGLKRLSIRQQERAPAYDSDFLVLEYAGKDKVYVPLNSLHLVQRYVGLEGHPPRVDSLGGTQWAKTKSKVQGEVQRMAEDLLQLYAEREVVQGHPFATPPSLSEEFAAAFEYEETPDQLPAIDEVLADMERPKPMDRLVCGDVGFGKTEVAVRAAFVAVTGGKQVAVLVPTTLLAQQHYQTFSNRFADWPLRVEVLTRFRSRKEQQAILRRSGAGAVDIVIGTHRLLQKDVQFKRLGLLIIDEEHRFGVRQKEKPSRRCAPRSRRADADRDADPAHASDGLGAGPPRDLSVIATPPPTGAWRSRPSLRPYDPASWCVRRACASSSAAGRCTSCTTGSRPSSASRKTSPSCCRKRPSASRTARCRSASSKR